MENKKWRMGDVHPETNKVFWSYSDRFQTKEGWLSREAFDRKYLKNKEYQKSDKSKLKSHEYYLANKDRIKEKRKAINKYKEEHNPLILLLATARNVSIRRNHNFNLDIKYMYELWDKQDGKCYYTGIPMTKTFNQKSPYQMSIDRIDSNIGYIKGNICLCCLSINFAKNSFTVEEIMKFISDLKAIELCQNKK